jgi:exopolyphosphatase/guanosine-5'-triphosphate,3'-diphosphate pyrophosphatase
MTMMNPSQPRLAGFDLGTNTFLLLIAEVGDGRVEPVFEKETVVRLGKGVDAAGNLNSKAMQRGLACLQEYVALAKQHGAEKIFAVGTSQLRDAANRNEFSTSLFRKPACASKLFPAIAEARLTLLALSNKPTSRVR